MEKTYRLTIFIQYVFQAETSVVFKEYYTDYLSAPETPCSSAPGYNFKDCVDRAVGKNISLLRQNVASHNIYVTLRNCY